LTSKQIALWNHSAKLQNELDEGNSTPERVKKAQDARQAYWNSLLPYQRLRNDGGLKTKSPYDELLIVAKEHDISVNDPILVRVVEAWIKGKRGQITSHQVESAISRFFEDIANAKKK